MSTMNPLDPYGGSTPNIEQQLGTAYDVVRRVAANLPSINAAEANKANIDKAAELADQVPGLTELIETSVDTVNEAVASTAADREQVALDKSAAENSAASAAISATKLTSALLVMGTYALAVSAASSMPNGHEIEVLVDESRNNSHTRYEVLNGGLNFQGLVAKEKLTNTEEFLGTDSARLLSAVTKNVNESSRLITSNKTLNVTDPVPDRGRSIYIGEHGMTGAGAYRREFSSVTDGGIGFRDVMDINPSVHLVNLSHAKSPKVVITGSSSGTWGPNTLDTSSGLPSLLMTALRAANPTKAFTFANLSIGGQTVNALNTVPSSFPSWYTNQTKPWLDYISEAQPDIVFIVIGSNDSQGISTSALKSVYDKIKAFSKPCDIVLMTQTAPNLSPRSDFASFGSREGQEGRDHAAGILRSFAKYYDIGLLDGNRIGNIVIDGRDIRDTSPVRVETDKYLNGTKFIATQEGHDFSMRLSFNPTQQQIEEWFTAALNPSNPLFLRVGSSGSEDSGDIVWVVKHTDGNFRFRCWQNGENYMNQSTTVPFPAGDQGPFALEFSKRDNILEVSVSGKEDTTKMQIKLRTGGGLITPRIGFYGLNTGPFSKLDFLNIGKPRKYIPVMTSDEAWGPPDNLDTKMPYGGNGINHMTSLCMREVWGRLLKEDALRAPNTSSGVYTPVLSPLVNASAATINRAWWSRVGNVVTVHGAMNVTPTNTANQVAVTMPLPIVSDLSTSQWISGTCFSRSNAADRFSGGPIYADSTNKLAYLQMFLPVAGANDVKFSFSYTL